MAEAFLKLSKADREAALGVAATKSGRPAHLLEKDVWVVLTLNALFKAAFGEHLVFKGGTSLSKAYGIIDRFSEDIDITYDIRQIVPDLVGDATDALPPNPSQEFHASRLGRVKTPTPHWPSSKLNSLLRFSYMCSMPTEAGSIQIAFLAITICLVKMSTCPLHWRRWPKPVIFATILSGSIGMTFLFER